MKAEDYSVYVKPLGKYYDKAGSDPVNVELPDGSASFEAGDVVSVVMDKDEVSVELSDTAIKDLSVKDINEIADINYAVMLSILLTEHISPDGSMVDATEIHGNSFSIMDIDRDGFDELIISWTSAAMAGQFFGVYQYYPQTGSVLTEFIGSPAGVEFYDNGVVLEIYSHNHTLGETWPYYVHRYDEMKDIYEYEYSVEALSRNMCPEEYPEEIDVDNYGEVYYTYDYEGTGNKTFMSRSQYEAFFSDLVSEANRIEVVFTELTESNVDTIR